MARITHQQLADALATQYVQGIRSTRPDDAQEHLRRIASGEIDEQRENAAAEALAFNRPFTTNDRS